VPVGFLNLDLDRSASAISRGGSTADHDLWQPKPIGIPTVTPDWGFKKNSSTAGTGRWAGGHVHDNMVL